MLIADAQAAGYAAELARRGLQLAVAVRDSIDSLGDVDDVPEVVLASPGYGAALLSAGARPAWLQSTWAGVRPLVEAGADHEVVITGLTGVFGPLISEYVFAHVLADVRELATLEALQRARDWQPRWPRDLREATLAVIGTGSIGAHVAITGQHFRMRTLGVSRSGAPVDGFERCVDVQRLHEVLAAADFVVATLPDTPATDGLIDAAAFAAMRADAMFINVGRGRTVDEGALLAALSAGRLRAAVLDVFVEEPLPASSPLWEAPGVTLTPHIAAVSHPRDVIDCFVANLERWRRGAPLSGVIDPARGY